MPVLESCKQGQAVDNRSATLDLSWKKTTRLPQILTYGFLIAPRAAVCYQLEKIEASPFHPWPGGGRCAAPFAGQPGNDGTIVRSFARCRFFHQRLGWTLRRRQSIARRPLRFAWQTGINRTACARDFSARTRRPLRGAG